MTDPAHAPEPMGAITGRLGFPERAIAPDQIRPEVVITHLSTVKPLPLEWLWQGYIPAGMITIIDGDPGLGKSMLTLDLVAKVTRGLPMPGSRPESAGRPRGAVLLSAEDDLAHTIVPRLIAAGADLDRVVVVSLRERDGTSREPIITPADLEAVEKAIVEVDAAIVIIDPLVAYLPATASANRDQDVRCTLAPLADLAERTGAAVVVVRHLRKAAADNALYRGGGSIAFIGAARVGLLVALDPDDETEQRRILASLKSNVGPKPPRLIFTVEVHPGQPQPRIVWRGETDHRADDLLVPMDRGERSAIDDAKEFLIELLAGGPVPSREVERQGLEAAISKASLGRAKTLLRVKSTRPEGFTGPWFWALPETYMRNEGRTSSPLEVEDVRAGLRRYGAASTGTADAAADGPSARWHCPAGSGHAPATHPDGTIYCGTCHP